MFTGYILVVNHLERGNKNDVVVLEVVVAVIVQEMCKRPGFFFYCFFL